MVVLQWRSTLRHHHDWTPPIIASDPRATAAAHLLLSIDDDLLRPICKAVVAQWPPAEARMAPAAGDVGCSPAILPAVIAAVRLLQERRNAHMEGSRTRAAA